ncbi:MAG: LuxR family transcriptional regulator [Pedobacter sp.]|nr:MAG: LuxR family transcriptional regulator [Pedobacter sp.]
MVAGLVCDKGEFFAHENKANLVLGGKRLTYPEFPLPVLQTIDRSIEPAHHLALDHMGFEDLHDRRNKWILCNQANLDFIPDYDPSKEKLEREVVECQDRQNCEYEGILCIKPSQSTGLTDRRLQVLQLIGKGMLNKEIAHKLKISDKTVAAHTKYLREATGCHRKADLALYAKSINLI